MAQTKQVDSLVILLRNTKDLEQKLNLHLSLSRLKLHRKPKEVLSHLNKARQHVKQLKNDSLLFEIYYQYANYYFLNQKHEQTFKYIDSAFAYKDRVPPEKVVRLHITLAQNSNFIGDQAQAITAYETALQLCIEYNLKENESGIYNGLASMYLNARDVDNAEINAKKAIEISRKNGSTPNEIYGTLTLGKIQQKQNKYSEALASYEAVNAYVASNPNVILEHGVNTNLGRLYRDINNLDLAIDYFEKNLKINKSINNDIGMNTSRTDIAQVLLRQKKYDQSIAILEENLNHARRIDNPKMIQQNLLDLSIVHEQKKSLKKALDYRKLYEKWQDSIVNTENLNAIAELEVKYETQKKENEILQLSQQQLVDELAIEKQSVWIKRLGFTLLLVVTLFAAAFVILKQRSKYQKEKELARAITDAQISEQQRISQDLHDSIGGSLALVKTKLKILQAEETNAKTINELIEAVSNTSNEVRQISHDLMPGELIKFGLASATNALLKQAESKTLETNLYVHDVAQRMDPKKEVHIFRILQELIQNALKHAKASTLNVYINKHPKTLNLIVEDDGIGFDMSGNDSSGIGFKTIQNRIAYLKGHLEIDSQKGKGSSFNIQIPLEI